jgi:hypothetical protein
MRDAHTPNFDASQYQSAAAGPDIGEKMDMDEQKSNPSM